MQCNFTFYLFASSSLALLKVVMKYLFDFFWKPISPFSKFCVSVFWDSNSYTVIIVFWMTLMEPLNASACWWPCAGLKCVSGLRRLEKTLNFLRCIHVIDLVLKYDSDINEENWLQLLCHFIVLMGIVASVIGMIFFHLCFRF